MLRTLPLLKALPWLLLAWAVSAGGAYALGRWHGNTAAAAQHQADGFSAYAAAVRQAADVLADVRDIGRRLAEALQASHRAEAQSVRTVREVIHANPDFAAVRRPAELERLRRQELEAIARAAAQAD